MDNDVTNAVAADEIATEAERIVHHYVPNAGEDLELAFTLAQIAMVRATLALAERRETSAPAYEPKP